MPHLAALREIKMKRRSLLIGCGSLVAGLAAPLARASASGARVVRFGQSAALTGPQAVYGHDVQNGIAAAFAAANANEASTGIHFELLTLDDGGGRTKCMSNALQMLETGSTALIGFTNGVAAEACMPMLEDTHAALLGTASGNMGLRVQAASGVFNVRAGYDVEFARIANYLRDTGMQRVALVRLNDTSPANRDAMTAALSSAGITPRASFAVDRHATDFSAVANELLAAKPDFVLMVANAGPTAAIISHLSAAKYPGLFYASSYAGQDLLDTLTARHQSCVMSVVVPRPSAMGVNVVAHCKRDLALLQNGDRFGITTLEGYIAGRTAVDATLLAARSGGVSRGRVKEALAGLRSDLGGYKVEFSGTTQGSHYVDLITLDKYGRVMG
jgi:branched-chain amino acid transport system substrate-binding protein